MKGICMTCGQPAEATFANQGYSDCCNDRITTNPNEIRQIEKELEEELKK